MTVHLQTCWTAVFVRIGFHAKIFDFTKTRYQQAVLPQWQQNDMLPGDGHCGCFRWLGDTSDHSRW